VPARNWPSESSNSCAKCRRTGDLNRPNGMDAPTFDAVNVPE
jgi:hypothetical protein